MEAMHWVPIEVRKPKYGQAVLVRYAPDNWLSVHTLADGSQRTHWRWQAARFCKDQWGDIWKEFGPGKLNYNDVTHWAAITDPLEENTFEQLTPKIKSNAKHQKRR